MRLFVLRVSQGVSGKEWPSRRCGFDPWVGKIPRRRKWQPTPVFLPEESHGKKPGGLRSMVSRKELNTKRVEL